MDVYICWCYPSPPTSLPSNIWLVAIIHNKITHITSDIISPIIPHHTIHHSQYRQEKSRNHTLLDTLHQQCIENVVSKQNLRGPISTLTDSSSDCQDIQVVSFLSKQAELVGYLTMYKTFNYFSCFQAYKSPDHNLYCDCST